MRIRGYFLKPKRVREKKKSLGNPKPDCTQLVSAVTVEVVAMIGCLDSFLHDVLILSDAVLVLVTNLP